jgi:single-strand DNA-binding protein
MNLFLATGNLGKDAEVKFTQGGTAICSFSIAVTSGYGDKAKTTWISCALFGKRAEGNLPQHLTKGTQVCVAGEIFMDEWQGQDGTTNKMLKMNVDKLDLIGGKQNTSAPQQGRCQPAPSRQTGMEAGAGMDDFPDDGIPFMDPYRGMEHIV